ncbi:hypothetical protein OY671_010955, partial [Metschnikowia pulcherrima]
FLTVRDWETLQEGVPFTDRDVRNGAQVCLVGQTIVRELFGGQSPSGQEIRIQNVSFKVVGLSTSKGANMVGMDQDDVVSAPWSTIKFRVSGATSVNSNQSASSTNPQVNTSSQLYPGPQSASSYPPTSATEAADTPQPIRFTTVDQISAKATTPENIPRAISQINALLR